MKRPRVSIAGLMGFVVLVALGFAALKNPTDLVASASFTLTLGLLLLSLLGVAFRRGDRQRSWSGFAVFGWGYLVTVLAAGALKPPDLLPGRLLAYLYPHLSHPVTFASQPGDAFVTFTVNSITATPAFIPGAWFYPIGQCLSTILVALLGSILVRIFASREA